MDNYWDGEHTVGARWLKKVLKDVNKDNIIVSFGHEPAFTCNTFHPNYYFRGHTHQYNLCTITHNGKIIHLIVSGGGGGFLQSKRSGIKNVDGYNVKPLELKSETEHVLVNVSAINLTTE